MAGDWTALRKNVAVGSRCLKWGNTLLAILFVILCTQWSSPSMRSESYSSSDYGSSDFNTSSSR